MQRTPLAVVLTLALAVHAWSQASQKRIPSAPKRLTVAQVWTLDAIYTDHEHGVTFRYPSAWTAGTHFAYHPPLLVMSRGDDIIAGFGYDIGGFPPSDPGRPYSGTNLEGFGFTYTTAASANQTQCETMAASIADTDKHTFVLIGKNRFSSYEVAQAGMSQSTGGNLYVTFAGSTCYFFETDTGWMASDVAEGIRPLTNRESSRIQAGLWAIMRSVRISPSGRDQ